MGHFISTCLFLCKCFKNIAVFIFHVIKKLSENKYLFTNRNYKIRANRRPQNRVREKRIERKRDRKSQKETEIGLKDKLNL